MESVQNALFIYGPLGIGCFGLGWVCIKLFNLYVASVNERLEDAKRQLDTINNNTNAMNSHTKTVETMVALLQARK